jgi:hypothetical protein
MRVIVQKYYDKSLSQDVYSTDFDEDQMKKELGCARKSDFRSFLCKID